jgi:hypothetical protein
MKQYAAAAATSSANISSSGGSSDVASSSNSSSRSEQESEEARVLPDLPPASIPSPCMLGSPFTTLAVTHNYRSLLHAEPFEHPFNYIVWLDVLGSGSKMEVSMAGTCPAHLIVVNAIQATTPLYLAESLSQSSQETSSIATLVSHCFLAASAAKPVIP